MSRTERLLDLVQTLRRHRRPVSGAQLADELAVSLRTIYRDIQTLIAKGAPIEGEAGIGYSYCVIISCRLYVAALAPQQGHRGRVLMSALIKRTRMVAIEFGMWRSGRKGDPLGL